MPGAPANSTKIGATQAGLVEAWRNAGHPFAEPDIRDIVADHATNLLDVRIAIAPGPLAVFGDPTVSGTDRLIPSFVAYMADIPVGATYDPEILRDAAARLRVLPALASVTIIEGDSLIQGALPLDIQVLGAQAPASSAPASNTTAPKGSASRPTSCTATSSGRAETLRLEAEVARIGEAGETSDYDAKLAARFTKPGLFNPYTRLESSLAFLQGEPGRLQPTGRLLRRLPHLRHHQAADPSGRRRGELLGDRGRLRRADLRHHRPAGLGRL